MKGGVVFRSIVLITTLLLLAACGDPPITYNRDISQATLHHDNPKVRQAIRQQCRQTQSCRKTRSVATTSKLPAAPATATLSFVESAQGDRGRYKNDRWCVIRSVPGLTRKAEVCTYRRWHIGQPTVDLVLVKGTAQKQFPRYIDRPPRYIRNRLPTFSTSSPGRPIS